MAGIYSDGVASAREYDYSTRRSLVFTGLVIVLVPLALIAGLIGFQRLSRLLAICLMVAVSFVILCTLLISPTPPSETET